MHEPVEILEFRDLGHCAASPKMLIGPLENESDSYKFPRPTTKGWMYRAIWGFLYLDLSNTQNDSIYTYHSLKSAIILLI